MIERSSIPEGMCSQRMFKSSKFLEDLRPKPTTVHEVFGHIDADEFITAIPTTGTVGTLVFKNNACAWVVWVICIFNNVEFYHGR